MTARWHGSGLEPRRYVLYVSRLEPENNADVVIDAWSRVTSDLPLVVVGDAPYASSYIAALHATTDPRVRFVGAIYGTGYRVLQSHAAVYVQATEVGGTHPALVEAMGVGAAIVANDVPEHREVLGDAGIYYAGVEALATALGAVLADPARLAAMREAAAARAGRRSDGTPSPTPTRRGSASSSARAPAADPVLSADVEDRPHHRASPARTARISPNTCSIGAIASPA